jgi:hypothetical protein
VLAALRRLGCPWSASVLNAAVKQHLCPHALRWMVQQGCPLDPVQAEAAAEHARDVQREAFDEYVDDQSWSDLQKAEEVRGKGLCGRPVQRPWFC